MPIYEYKCSHCSQEIEVLQKTNDDPPAACYVCDRGTMNRKLSAGNFHLKGKGWYATDFKGKS